QTINRCPYGAPLFLALIRHRHPNPHTEGASFTAEREMASGQLFSRLRSRMPSFPQSCVCQPAKDPSSALPLLPKQQSCLGSYTSETCPFTDMLGKAAKGILALLDYLVSEGNHPGRHGHAQCAGGVHVDQQLKPRRKLDRQLARLRPLQN